MESKAYLSDDEADAIVSAAREAASEAKIPVCIAVVDEASNLLRFARVGDVPLISVEVSIAKAVTAAKMRMSTADLAGMVGNSIALLALPGALPFPGGIPLLQGSTLLGAIGVSGGTPDDDQRIAAAGLSAIA